MSQLILFLPLFTGTPICIFSNQLHSLQPKFQQNNISIILGRTRLARPRRPYSRTGLPPLSSSHNWRWQWQRSCSQRGPNQPKKSSKKAQHSVSNPISIGRFLSWISPLFHPGPFNLSRLEIRPICIPRVEPHVG